MADDSRENNQMKLDTAINELAERKNDVVGSFDLNKPSSSIPQKRPSPNLNDHQLLTKRVNPPPPASFGSIVYDNSRENEENIENIDALKCLREDRKQDRLAGSSKNEESSDNEHQEVDNINSITKSTIIKSKEIFMNSSLNINTFMEEFKTKWLESEKSSGCQTFNKDGVKLFNYPFKICVVSEFLEKSSITQEIVEEMSQMEWHRKQMDLYEFHQTTDLANLPPNAKPVLKTFYNMLLKDMLPWMKEITGLPLTHISASCSMYNYGDYLLVHDDLLSDRQIAFVFYCSPFCEDWQEEMGGALELFESDPFTVQPKYPIVQKFSPRNNQFVFFRVGKDSFHQVGEVTNLVYPRLTINGWFHGPASNENEKIIEHIAADSDTSYMNYQSPINDELNLHEWISACYLRKKVKLGIQQHIEDKSEASLELFLIPQFFELLVSEFKDNTELNWVLEGPANKRKYETLHFTPHSTGPLKDLYALFTSDSMFGLLHEYTELDLNGSNIINPTCSVQLCRFTQGCYTLLGDSASFADSALDVILFFNVNNGVGNFGKITYLSPSQDVSVCSTAVETDATTSSIDISGIDTSDISINQHKKNASNLSTISKNSKHKSHHYNTCSSSNAHSLMETSEEEINPENLSTSGNNDTLTKKITVINSTTKKLEVRAIVHENNDIYDIDSNHSEILSEDEDFDELAQEDALLTIHPENNSLNLVYRLSGQTKFVKYISKNCLKSDEYIYILFATYKE